MSYECRIEKDSITKHGHRLTTFVVTFPRIVLAELNTHRTLSRNSASSRAIPVDKQIAKIKSDLFYPVHWGKNQKGMQAESELNPIAIDDAKALWKYASFNAVSIAEELLEVGVHKQITNRLLEPFMWHTAVVSGTEWSNFFHLRDNAMAQPEIKEIAGMMNECYQESIPSCLTDDDWHLPFVGWDDEVKQPNESATDGKPFLARVSAGRSARVSYLTHDGRRDFNDDLALYDRLATAGHMSPLEHPCRPMTDEEYYNLFSQQQFTWNGDSWKTSKDKTHFLGNVQGWVQLRKLIPDEEDALGRCKVNSS